MARGEKNEAGDAAGPDLAKISDIGKRFTRLPSSRDVLTDLLKVYSFPFFSYVVKNVLFFHWKRQIDLYLKFFL